MESFEKQFFERSQTEKVEKPPVLYHASFNRNIEVLEPRKSSRDPEEGDIVFGAPDLAFATMFLVESDDSWTIKGKIGKKYMMIIGDKERFEGKDKGGSIYVLPNKSFECDQGKRMGKCEWHSKESVKPIDKIEYPSGLDAMIENGVQVYFVNKEFFRDIRKATERANMCDSEKEYSQEVKHDLEILKRLESLESENKQRGSDDKDFLNDIKKELGVFE